MKCMMFMMSALALTTVVVAAPAATANAEDRPAVVVESFVNKTDAPDTVFTTLKSRIENEIINTRKFNYLERGDKLREIMKERSRKASATIGDGMEDAEQAPLKAAGYAIYGEILFLGVDQMTTSVAEVNASKFTAKVELQLRFADIETGEVLASKTIMSQRSASRTVGEGMTSKSNFSDQGMNEAVTDAAKKVVAALMELAYPTKVLAINRAKGTITVNLTKEQTAVDKVYEVYALGEELIDPDTGESLGSDEECLGRATVIRSLPKIAILEANEDLDITAVEKGMTVREVDEETLARERKKAKLEKRRKLRSRF